MTLWTEMSAIHFDQALAPTPAKARKIVAAIKTADETLFPDLKPETTPRKTASAAQPMPGEVAMFDLT